MSLFSREFRVKRHVGDDVMVEADNGTAALEQVAGGYAAEPWPPPAQGIAYNAFGSIPPPDDQAGVAAYGSPPRDEPGGTLLGAVRPRRTADILRGAAKLRAWSETAEDAARERSQTRAGMRLDNAMQEAEKLGTARSGAAEAATPLAAERPVLDSPHLYLIHVDNSSTSLGAREIDLLPDRLKRAARNKARTMAMAEYLWDTDPEVSGKLAGCNTYRVFRHWLESGDCRLLAAFCCRQDKLCPVCAHLRAGRMSSRYHKRVMTLLAQKPTLREYLMTFTIVNGPDLVERLTHLRDNLTLLIDHRRKVRNGSSRHAWMPFCGAAGGVYSIEIKIGSGSGLWHVHVHIYLVADQEIPYIPGIYRCFEMEDWWRKRTGDSYVVDVRPVISPTERVGALCEVLKYTLKISEMTLAQNVEAWRVTTAGNGMRLMQSFGELVGVPDVKILTDELSRDEGQFLDMFYRFDSETGLYQRVARTPESVGDVPPIQVGEAEEGGL